MSKDNSKAYTHEIEHRGRLYKDFVEFMTDDEAKRGARCLRLNRRESYLDGYIILLEDDAEVEFDQIIAAAIERKRKQDATDS